jgi:hypothetical protein
LAKTQTEFLTFNRGVVSALAQARTDIKRVNMSAKSQVNWIPRVLGPMSIRPGQAYLLETENSNVAFHIPFIFSLDDTAIIQLTDQTMRVIVDDVAITRVSVATTIANGNFDSNVNSWTDNDESGCTSDWLTGGYMRLIGNGTLAAIRDQSVSVAVGDQAKVHAIRVVVEQGDLIFRVGTTSGGDELVTETVLRKGTHSLTFTPGTGTIYVRLMSRTTYNTLVDSVNIESSGALELPTPWTEAELPNVRFEQSGDVIWVACGPNIRQMRIERRSATSWSVVDYLANLGPFRPLNLTPVTITPSGLTGNITLSSSAAFFKTTNVGGLIAINSLGQTVTASITAQNTFTSEIRVTGIGEGRRFGLTITGLTGTGSSVTLQRSVGAPGAWVDVISYTTNQTTTYLDALDNQIIYYRIGVATGDYSSGTIVPTLAYTAGSIKGIARITAFTSATVVSAIVLKDFGATTASPDWAEGSWSARRGYPSAVALHEGRLWWAGFDKIDGSVSDDFANYSDEVEGDAAPISRSIGTGPVETINWLLPAQLLIMGGQGSEFICRSSTLGEPLTPLNFNIKEATTRGSLRVAAVKVDSSAVFVDRSGSRVYEMEYDSVSNNYAPIDLTSIVPEIAAAGVRRIGVQRRPDTRFHLVLDDGTVALLVFDKAEDVRAWVTLETEGDYEDVIVMPGTLEDQVYYCVRRTIQGSNRRYLERVALQSECEGGAVNKLADSFILYSGAVTTTLTGLTHLIQKEVVVWGDGVDLGTFTVDTNGEIVVPTGVANAVIGLSYNADYESSKLGAIGQRRNIQRIALALYKTHYKGLKYGTSFDTLDDMPDVEQWETTEVDTIWDEYDNDSTELNGSWENDARLCLRATAPKPCTVLGARVIMDQNG